MKYVVVYLAEYETYPPDSIFTELTVDHTPKSYDDAVILVDKLNQQEYPKVVKTQIWEYEQLKKGTELCLS